MVDAKALCGMVEHMAGRWPQRSGLWDYNLEDVYWLAQEIEKIFSVTLAKKLPSEQVGVDLFESVEKHLVADPPQNRCLQGIPAAEVGRRAQALLIVIERDGLLSGSPAQNLVVALYTWHGCINMAKVLRKDYVTPTGLQPYTPEMRRDGYQKNQACWNREEGRGNPWVRYGVSLARPMEQNRKKEKFPTEVIENWVPADSPYWDSKHQGEK